MVALSFCDQWMITEDYVAVIFTIQFVSQPQLWNV